jgi:hypothetical protein
MLRQTIDQKHKPDERERDQPRSPLQTSVAAVLALQRTAGNHAVASHVGRCATCGETPRPHARGEHDESVDAETWGAIRESARERGIGRSAYTASIALPRPEEPAGRSLPWMRMARTNMDLTGIGRGTGSKVGQSKYGHWWTEISQEESYGWYPKYDPQVGIGPIDALRGVEGELNGQTCCNGTPTQDPCHGDNADQEFNPVYAGTKTDEELRDDARGFANGYSGEWRWTFGAGQNCRTFQIEMMDEMELREP